LKKVKEMSRVAVIPGSDLESVEMNAGFIGTDPESTFIASACECGVAVQGDGLLFRETVFYVLEKKPTPPWSLGNKIPSLVFCSRKFSAKTYPISIATK